MKRLVVLFIIIACSFESIAQGPQQKFWALNNNGIFLLDQIGSTGASVAYSVRKLRRHYTGFVIRVRKQISGTDPIGDVAFDASNQLSASSVVTITTAGGGYSVGDKVTFSTFYSGSSVYVVTWYDQSGNARDVTQATTSQQPRIVNAGTLETSNSKATVRFISSNATVLTATIASSAMFGSGYLGTASLVLEASSGNTSAFGYADGGTDRWQAHINESNNLYFDVGSSYNRLSYVNTSNIGLLRTYALVAGSSLMQIWVSGVNVSSSTPTMSASTTGTFYLGAVPPFPSDWYHNNDESEVIIFPKALSTIEIGMLNRNQKLFFSTP